MPKQIGLLPPPSNGSPYQIPRQYSHRGRGGHLPYYYYYARPHPYSRGNAARWAVRPPPRIEGDRMPCPINEGAAINVNKRATSECRPLYWNAQQLTTPKIQTASQSSPIVARTDYVNEIPNADHKTTALSTAPSNSCNCIQYESRQGTTEKFEMVAPVATAGAQPTGIDHVNEMPNTDPTRTALSTAPSDSSNIIRNE